MVADPILIPAEQTTREERLEEIKRQLEEGTYTIDLALLAEQIVDQKVLDE